jgi:hypothetical protein
MFLLLFEYFLPPFDQIPENVKCRSNKYMLSGCELIDTKNISPPVSSTNKTDCHDITEILMKVALNTIKQTNKFIL